MARARQSQVPVIAKDNVNLTFGDYGSETPKENAPQRGAFHDA